MRESPAELIWAVIIGAVVFVVLGAALVISVVVSQRRRLALRQKMLDELRRSEERYRSLVENISEIYCVLDGQRRIVYGSPNLFEITGRTPEEVVGRTYERLVDRKDRRRVVSLLDDSRSTEAQDFVSEFRLLRRGFPAMWVEQNTRVVRDDRGSIREYRHLLRDITERKANEEIMRGMSGRVMEAQELERRRVARELHDGINQLLSSIQFRLKSIEERRSVRQERVVRGVSEARELMDEAIREVRRISHNLRPTILDDFGLLAAVRSTSEEFQLRTGIVTVVDAEGLDQRLPEQAELVLFRIIQEALTNIERHSGARNVRIQLLRQDQHLSVRVKDDGCGFEPSSVIGATVRRRGLGLDGMRERTTSIGGLCEIVSRKKGGTEIILEIPLTSNGTSQGLA